MNAMVVSQPRLNLVEIRYDIKDPLKEVVLRLGEFLVTLCNVGEEKKLRRRTATGDIGSG